MLRDPFLFEATQFKVWFIIKSSSLSLTIINHKNEIQHRCKFLLGTLPLQRKPSFRVVLKISGITAQNSLPGKTPSKCLFTIIMQIILSGIPVGNSRLVVSDQVAGVVATCC